MKTNYLAAKCGGRAHWPSTARLTVGVANLVMYRILDRLKGGDVWVLRWLGTDLLFLGLHSMEAIQAGQNRRVAPLQRAFVARLAAASAARDIHRRRPPLAQCARPLHTPPPAPAPAPSVRPSFRPIGQLLVRPPQWSWLSLARSLSE